MLRKLIVGVFAVQASPLQKPCQDLFDKCVAEISEMGQVSEGCEQMPWCDADGYFFQGKIFGTSDILFFPRPRLRWNLQVLGSNHWRGGRLERGLLPRDLRRLARHRL